MSKVYEALKKAERDGRWRDNPHQTPAAVGSAPPSKNNRPAAATEEGQESPAHFAAAAEHGGSESEGTPLASSSLQPLNSGSQNRPANDKPANGIVTTQDPDFFGAQVSGKAARRWRFWQHETPWQTRGPRLIINQESLSRAAEQFQVLRANLESWVLERDQRIILITSALPGEGKSFIALNLAVALSRAGSNVLLVDADLRAPSMHLPFNLVPLSGLLPYLEGKAEFARSITETPEQRLGLIAAGGVTLSGPEALAGSRMKALVECARQLRPPHIVLLDAPAVAAGAGTQILSRLVDAVLLVVAANMTSRAAVARTLELIKGVPVLSAVLNRFELSFSASRHLHYYGKYKAAADT
ncbi:MAG: CpsD/CapB family tyrosine-protein kinase [Deltaproteobacteria bacterium]|nr:CpsD/CapB family tyrosine-protein kinase [Deltaproteobacteria bacterium]